MKRFIIVIAVLAAAVFCSDLRAQDTEMADSLVFVPTASMDESLLGQNIFSIVPVKQSQAISSAMNSKVAKNKTKKMVGYRVRIFFDNKQNSRGASEAAVARFRSAYPGHGTYRTFVNPYFKVTVGDFRTKSEAMQLMNAIKGDFPAAFVIKEQINYPIVDRNHSYTVDTVKVAR